MRWSRTRMQLESNWEDSVFTSMDYAKTTKLKIILYVRYNNRNLYQPVETPKSRCIFNRFRSSSKSHNGCVAERKETVGHVREWAPLSIIAVLVVFSNSDYEFSCFYDDLRLQPPAKYNKTQLKAERSHWKCFLVDKPLIHGGISRNRRRCCCTFQL